MAIETDILIVGGGIIGLSVASEIVKRYSDVRITIIEKEESLARHGSGRNSGVLHAGFYYSKDSLKAKLTSQGNALMTQYCLENGLAIQRSGKCVVARDKAELETLYELKKRGDYNGVTLDLVDEKTLESIEPNAKTYQYALYSPTTSTVDPKEVVNHIGTRLQGLPKVSILFGEKFIDRDGPNAVQTNKGHITFKHLINTAGLYAEKIAQRFGIGHRFIMIPFKGLYLEYKDESVINTLIYPVPNINNPFLGTHFTKTVHNKVKIGPTAIPAYWRENYDGLDNFDFNEFLETISLEADLFIMNTDGFRTLALKEMRKYLRSHLIEQAATLVKNINPRLFGEYLTPGIRAQLFDRKTKHLVSDFIMGMAENSTHILNAVSPAFTCAFSLSALIVDEVGKNIN